MIHMNYREGAACQHRSLALFAMIQCWMKNQDGIAIQRNQLSIIFGIEKFMNERIEWLKDDFSSYFPYSRIHFDDGKKVFSHLIFSKKNLDFLGSNNNQPIDLLINNCLIYETTIGLFSLLNRSAKNSLAVDDELPFLRGGISYHDSVISSYLLLLSQGKITPDNHTQKTKGI